MADRDFKALTRRTVSDKIFRNKVFNIAKHLKYDGYERGLALMIYKFFDKKTSDSGIKNENISNKELTEELRKPVIRKFKKKSTLTFYRQYLGCCSCWYAIKKQIW